MKQNNKTDFILDKNQVVKKYTCSSRKAGGQNLNRVHTCVVLTHLPTGIIVRSEETRNQGKNEEIAWKRLYDKLKDIEENKSELKNNSYRNNQIGSGGRGNGKRRTYRIKDNLVIDYITGKECRWLDFQKGKIELLF